MSNNDRWFVCGHQSFWLPLPAVQFYSCNEFGHFAQDCPNMIPLFGTPQHQEKSCSRPQYTHIQGTITLHPLWAQIWETFYFNCSQPHHHSQCNKSSSNSRRHSSHTPSSQCSSLHCPSADKSSHHHSHHDTPHMYSHTPSCTCHFSHWHHSCHYSIDWSQSHSSNSYFTVWGTQPMRKAKPHPRPSTPKKSQQSKTVIIQDSHQTLPQIRHLLWSFKLLEPSHSSNEDEQVGQSLSIHYTPGLVSDYPTVTVHTGKRFKALINSEAAISLAHTSVNNMTEDCYKTKILPAAVLLKTAGWSSMSSLGKATLHLHTANFKSAHTLIICDKLPETDILFSIDTQKRYCLSYSWDSDKQLFIQREDSYLTCTRNCEQ